MENKNKRKRSENWDSSQKILLRQLIEERIDVIENNSVDTNTSKAKREAWNQITNDFNEISSTKRDTSQLQTQWRAAKMKAKANNSAYKRSRTATGGGPPPKSPDQEDDKLISLIPHEFEVDFNEFDCDFSTSMIQKENVTDVPKTKGPETSTSSSKTPLGERSNQIIVNNDFDFDEVEFLEDEIPIPNAQKQNQPEEVPSTSKVQSEKKFPKKKTNNCKNDELKQQLLEAALENKRLERNFMQAEHDFKMKLREQESTGKIKNLRLKRQESSQRHEIKMKTLKCD